MTASRRDLLRLGAAAGVGLPLSDWFRALAADAAPHPDRKRAVILLWMYGGPATIDLRDLKPGHANGGLFKDIPTAAPGLRISEYLPRVAAHGNELAVVRSMSTREGDHTRASHLARTGNIPQGAIRFPGLGALVAKELLDDRSDLLGYVSVLPPGGGAEGYGYGSGFLGPRFAPVLVGNAYDENEPLTVPDLAPAAGTTDTAARRTGLAELVDRRFTADRDDPVVASHREAAARAARMMRPEAARAFRLDEEPEMARAAYGPTQFGRGCLLARRLVERGVPFVEVTLDGWDTHNNNFPAVQALSRTLDAGFGALLADLKARGMLSSTLVVCMGEFGRTPRINGGAGRDHWPAAWAMALAGGGVRGGQAVGRTSPDGLAVDGRPTGVPDLLATICRGIGIDHTKMNESNVNRPIRIVDKSARVIEEVVS